MRTFGSAHNISTVCVLTNKHGYFDVIAYLCLATSLYPLHRQISCDSRGVSIGTPNCFRGLAFCDGSASAPRGVVSRVFNINTSDVSANCNSSGALVEHMGTSPISDSVCNDTFM